jgi:LEA14-like dessication related protein
MRKAHSSVMLLLSAALLLLSGCAATRLEKPHLQVVGVQMMGGNLLQQQLRVRLHVQNPNDRELQVRSVTYELEVAGEKFAHGTSESDFIVPARGETDFDVNVTANAAAAVLKLLGSSAKLDDVDYRVVGRVQLAKGFVRNIPFDHSGRFKLK